MKPNRVSTGKSAAFLFLSASLLVGVAQAKDLRKTVKKFREVEDAVSTAGIAPNSCEYCVKAPRKTPPAVTRAPYQDAKIRRQDFPLTGKGCELKTYSLTTYRVYEQDPGEDGSIEYAFPTIETTGDECAKEYGFVQFMKGCRANFNYDPKTGNMTPATHIGLVTLNRGNHVDYNFRDWTVDSGVADAMYGTSNERGRFEVYRMPGAPLLRQADPSSLKTDSDVYLRSRYTRLYEAGRPLGKVFFTKDQAWGGMVINKKGPGAMEVINASMLFKTCVYRTKDIPTSGDPKPPGTPLEQGGPISCLEWDNQHIFNPQTGRFDYYADGIHPSCNAK